ncbi:hypothetical protein CNMCM5793_008803 [Aspergillus hiratsukae]|uniref:HNH nuclease domain-containing protein n=1 Tax=Aspergillus hiratsukae TaxID=1194566 RepID=A0A8H6UTD9_9EURO|nr:hypothetical protein CNMCM5793_008803 [Aspergillus hiratsukae]KAF7162485.1 hypothetical protein CNMCM6106_009402 [Aspergillus hiratsukae]
MLGGLFQNGSVTRANFIDMLNIVLVIGSRQPRIKARTGQTISRTTQPLAHGDYDIYAPDGDSIKLSDEPFVLRLPPYRVRGRESDFDMGVRARDGKCVFTGLVNKLAEVDYWVGFEAAHIFPLEKESYWIEHGFSEFITNADSGNAPIQSIQNGFLLEAGSHQLFDDYAISVNPDASGFYT